MHENIAPLMMRSEPGQLRSFGERMRSNMLVLSRRAGEAIVIGGEIEVVILGTHEGQVRVGIRAPREIQVLRKELLTKVQAEKLLSDGEGSTVDPAINIINNPRTAE